MTADIARMGAASTNSETSRLTCRSKARRMGRPSSLTGSHKSWFLFSGPGKRSREERRFMTARTSTSRLPWPHSALESGGSDREETSTFRTRSITLTSLNVTRAQTNIRDSSDHQIHIRARHSNKHLPTLADRHLCPSLAARRRPAASMHQWDNSSSGQCRNPVARLCLCRHRRRALYLTHVGLDYPGRK